MQIRFDGTLGFAGGYVDADDTTIVSGLNRELVEELQLDLRRHNVCQEDYLFSHVCVDKMLVTHFYKLEVSVVQFHEIEQRSLEAREWGLEVMFVYYDELIVFC